MSSKIHSVFIPWDQIGNMNSPAKPTPQVQDATVAFNLGAKGQYHWQVLEKGEVVNQSEKRSNYIFDAGLDHVSQFSWADCFKFCRLGNQSTPSGSTGIYETVFGAAHQSEISGPFGVSDETYYFTGFVPVISGIGGFDGCGSHLTGLSGIHMRRTFDFPEHPVGTLFELPPSGYSEIGWSPLQTGNLFSRVITTGGNGLPEEVLVYEGQSLRVIYELTTFIGPSGKPINENIITGWLSSGIAGVQLLGLSSVSGDGTSQFWDQGSGANEPAVRAGAFISDANNPLEPIGSFVDRSTGVFHESGVTHHFEYIGGHTRTKRYFVTKNTGVHSGYNCLGIGASGDPATLNTFVHTFYDPVDKDQDYILNAKFIYNWNRLP